jgi:hypothetical protein
MNKDGRDGCTEKDTIKTNKKDRKETVDVIKK